MVRLMKVMVVVIERKIRWRWRCWKLREEESSGVWGEWVVGDGLPPATGGEGRSRVLVEASAKEREERSERGREIREKESD